LNFLGIFTTLKKQSINSFLYIYELFQIPAIFPDHFDGYLSQSRRPISAFHKSPGSRGQDPVSGKIISGIYSFTGLQEQEFFNYLQTKRIHISLRGDVLRFAPHFYNTIGEMEEVVRMCEAYKNT
jgi:hypothetical protein